MMMEPPLWWARPRRVTVLVDNPSWVLPFAARLVSYCREGGDEARLARSYDDMLEEGTAFLIGCTRLTPPDILGRNHRNLVVHASDLPRGRGHSPLAWQIEEGRSTIPICLFDAAPELDTGAVIYRDTMEFSGHELIEELHDALGQKTIELCQRFLCEPVPPVGEPQQGEPTYYKRRSNDNNRLDPNRTIADQFDKLRVCDNERFPAHFEMRGHRYRLKVEKERPA
jgi:methionyl-tRNA formyltransferase